MIFLSAFHGVSKKFFCQEPRGAFAGNVRKIRQPEAFPLFHSLITSSHYKCTYPFKYSASLCWLGSSNFRFCGNHENCESHQTRGCRTFKRKGINKRPRQACRTSNCTGNMSACGVIYLNWYCEIFTDAEPKKAKQKQPTDLAEMEKSALTWCNFLFEGRTKVFVHKRRKKNE